MAGALWECSFLSKDQLHGKLQLPGGAGIAGLETGVADHAKGRVYYKRSRWIRHIQGHQLGATTGLAKVGMIQQIKDFKTKLVAESLGDAGSLADGEIHIVKARSSDHIAGQIGRAHV